jgi:K+-transporting ATPase A subunit
MKNLRHFKALMRKNFINWKRTPVGTTLEILLPICLMIALAIARQRIQPQIVDDLSLFSLRHPLYPIASPINNSWVIDTGPKSFADKNL